MDQPASQNYPMEGEVFFPSPEVVANANVQEYEALYKYSIEDPQGFWGERAGELEWYQKWDKVLDDSNHPFYKWFVGGKTNIVHNALDRHLKTYRKNKLALIWEGEPGDTRTYSYYSLNLGVCKFANVLRSLGVKKGDIVTIYLPRIPEHDLKAYAERHGLPEHPLVAKGYPSIGCVPCTSRVAVGEDARAGRWRGLDKTECGIHVPAEADGSGI